MLTRGDYNWWWKCYFTSASPVLYVILYAIYYAYSLNLNNLGTIIIYCGIMGLMVFGLILVCGTISLFFTFAFLLKIYSLIKVD